MTPEQVALELTGMWYEMVTIDHHKDRDCYWYIEQVWSYGRPPTWRVRHDGYVGLSVEVAGMTSYGGALRALIETLMRKLPPYLSVDAEYASHAVGLGRLDKKFIERRSLYAAALEGLPPRKELQEIDPWT